jgi:hypothetical protein
VDGLSKALSPYPQPAAGRKANGWEFAFGNSESRPDPDRSGGSETPSAAPEMSPGLWPARRVDLLLPRHYRARMNLRDAYRRALVDRHASPRPDPASAVGAF